MDTEQSLVSSTETVPASGDRHAFDTPSDIRMVQQLLAQAPYKIPEHLRQKVLMGAEAVIDADADKVGIADKLNASRLVLKADELNLNFLKLAIPKKIEHINVRHLSDDELLDAVKDIQKLLPRVVM